MKIRMFSALTAVALSFSYLYAQPPAPPSPPPPAAAVGTATNLTGRIAQFNYGPEGRVEGLVLAPHTLVSLPPDWAMQIDAIAKVGDQVSVTGTTATTNTSMQLMDAQTLSVGGRNFSLNAPSQPAPYTGSGLIRQLNYGRQGEVNGFVLQNGVIARTPPFGASDVSVIRAGATIALSGFARTTASGKTVVDVQSLTANGQTIALSAAAAPGVGPGRGPGRQGRNAPPPPTPEPARDR